MFDALKNLKKQAEKAAGTHGDKISGGLEKAGDLVDKRTGHKHSSKIDTAVEKTRTYVEKLGRKNS